MNHVFNREICRFKCNNDRCESWKERAGGKWARLWATPLLRGDKKRLETLGQRWRRRCLPLRPPFPLFYLRSHLSPFSSPKVACARVLLPPPLQVRHCFRHLFPQPVPSSSSLPPPDLLYFSPSPPSPLYFSPWHTDWIWHPRARICYHDGIVVGLIRIPRYIAYNNTIADTHIHLKLYFCSKKTKKIRNKRKEL